MASQEQTEVLILGGGIAGLVTALELLRGGRRVTLIEQGDERRLGGMAREAFGGIFLVDSPIQRRAGIRDSIALAERDWRSVAGFDANDQWPQAWLDAYLHAADRNGWLPHWFREQGLRFFPVVNWVERGLYVPGNSVPRFHLLWGTGQHLVIRVLTKLAPYRASGQFQVQLGQRCLSLTRTAGNVDGCRTRNVRDGSEQLWRADQLVLASGGFCGDIERVRRQWPLDLGEPPSDLLSGALAGCDGHLHDAAAEVGARLTHIRNFWSYAAGVADPRPDLPSHGISLVPPRSALWVNAQGRRIGPEPMVSGYDTYRLVEQLCQQPGQYGWQILNRRIAIRELAASGSAHNEAFRDRRLLTFLKNVLLGNPALVDRFLRECPDFVTAGDLDSLSRAMQRVAGDNRLETDSLRMAVREYDGMNSRPKSLRNDDQLRRLADLRRYRGDRVRLVRRPLIEDPHGYPLIAIRTRVLTRKSLGGVQTDLGSRVLDRHDKPIPGLYAVGEAAGFGGGGIHGRRALEGTFLGAAIVTAKHAATAILEDQ